MSATWKVLFSERLGELGDGELQLAQRYPVELSVASLRTVDELKSGAADADILVVGAVEPVNAEVLRALPGLKAVVRRGIGVDNVDLDAATALGIPVAYVPAASVEEVSDHALALSLSIARSLPEVAAAIAADRVADAAKLGDRSRRFADTTLGIVGFGRIGRALARKASSVFGGIVAADPLLPSGTTVDDVEIVPLEALWGRADIISLHAPSLPGQGPIVDAASIAAMHDGVLLVNTARPQLVDEDALAEAIRSGRVAGAALDVTSTEPLPASSPLRELPGVLLTGHTASKGRLAAVNLRVAVIEAIEALVQGRPPEFVANPAVLESSAYRPKGAES